MYPDDAHKKRKGLTPKEAREKIEHYCAYQERSHYEVRNKLFDYGLYSSDVDEILSSLIVDGFLNEERFAISYAGGKFRMKKWGRIKIIQGLKAHRVSEYCIKKALSELDEEDYFKTLTGLIEAKKMSLTEKNPYEMNHKLARFVISKGYEPSLVWEILKSGN